MELTRTNGNLWDPIDLFSDLTGLNRALSQNRWAKSFEPDIEVREEADHYLVHADLPGMKKEDFSLSVEGKQLILKGERKQERERKEKEYHYSERVYGAFTRSFEFPAEINAEKIKASYKDGVLEIQLPKAETAKPKQIKVE